MWSIVILISLCTTVSNAIVNQERLSSFPYISGDSFRAIADHIFDDTNPNLDPKRIKSGDIIFLKTDYLKDFFTKIHPLINNKYILITHNSDYGVPGIYESYLNDKQLHIWLGMSPTVIGHPKFEPIPIGIANEYWRHGDTDTFNRLLKCLKVASPKKYLVGINFTKATNIPERAPAYDYFSKQSFCANIGSSNHYEYLKNMALTKFVVCPAGNSLDCHRTWEALLVGCIPILKHSHLDPMLQGLPVVLVHDWHEVTQEFLERKYKEIHSDFISYDKAFFPYWFRKIEYYKNQIIK